MNDQQQPPAPPSTGSEKPTVAAPTVPGWYECRCISDGLKAKRVFWFDGKRMSEHRAPQDVWHHDVNHYTDFHGPLTVMPEGWEELVGAAKWITDDLECFCDQTLDQCGICRINAALAKLDTANTNHERKPQ